MNLSRRIAKAHHTKIHMSHKDYVCEICKKSFTDENHLKKHIQVAHMLPKLGENGSMVWEIVKPKENGKVSCLECGKTFSSGQNYTKAHENSMAYAKEHFKTVHMSEVKSVKRLRCV